MAEEATLTLLVRDCIEEVSIQEEPEKALTPST
jgi:hypothetical protein